MDTLITLFVTKLGSLSNKLFKNKLTKLIYNSNNSKHNVYVYDNFLFRWLSFGGSAVQSKICHISKYFPCLPVFKIMSLAGVLYKTHEIEQKYNPDEQHDILILGLGGGDILRYFHKLFNINQLGNINIKVIELSPEVINIAKQYFYIDKILNHNITILQQDAYDYISTSNNIIHNIIVLDFFTEVNSAMRLVDIKYIETLYNMLNHNGVLVINTLFSNKTDIDKFITLINLYFDKNIIIVSSPKHYNVIIFAFKNNKYLEYITSNKNSYLIKRYLKNITYCNSKGYQADFN